MKCISKKENKYELPEGLAEGDRVKLKSGETLFGSQVEGFIDVPYCFKGNGRFKVFVKTIHKDDGFCNSQDVDIDDIEKVNEAASSVKANEFKITVVECPRCQKRHDDLRFKSFSRPTGEGYTHFSTCPKTEEPILFYMKRESYQDYFDGMIRFQEPVYK